MAQKPGDNFPYESVMELVQRCRNDQRVASAPGAAVRRRIVKGIAGEIAGHHGIDPDVLLKVTANMIDGRDIHPSWFVNDKPQGRTAHTLASAPQEDIRNLEKGFMEIIGEADLSDDNPPKPGM